MQPAFFWIWLFIHSNTTQAKHTIETAYSGKKQLTCVQNLSLIPSQNETDKLAAQGKHIALAFANYFIKHRFVARKNKARLPCRDSQKQ